MTITKDSTDQYIMVDEKNNKKYFKHGYLTQIRDSNQNKIDLLYNGKEYNTDLSWHPEDSNQNRVTKIIQINKKKTSDIITVATFTYNGNGYITGITDANGRTTTISYSGTNVTKITHPDGTYAQYTYDSNYMTKAYDSESKIGIKYGYRVKNNGRKISSIAEYAIDDSGSEQIGATIAVDGSKINSTTYRDLGADQQSGTNDDILTEIQFDYAGRTVNESSTDKSKKKLYGATSTAFTGTGKTSTSNKVSSDLIIGVHGVNLLQNGGFEAGGSGWRSTRIASDSSKISVNVGDHCAANGVRSGTKAAKLTIDAAATENSSGQLRCIFNKPITLTAGKTYTYSGYVKTTDSSQFDENGKIYLRIIDGSEQQLCTSAVIRKKTSPDIEDGWVQIYTSYKPSETATYTLQVVSDHVKGTMYYDDFQVEESESPSKYNILDNGDAEWTAYWTTDHNAEYYANAKYTGSTGIRIQGHPNEIRYTTYTVPMNESSNNTFLLSGWGKGYSVPDTSSNDCGKRYFGLKMNIEYADGSVEKHYVPFNDNLKSWQYVSGNIVPKKRDQTITKMIVYCVFSKNANAAYFDNISLRKEPVETYKYDSKGNVVSVNQPNTNQAGYTYNGADLISATSAGSGTFQYEYDSNHNPTSVTNDSVKMSITYDASGNMTNTEIASTSNTSAKKSRSSATTSANGNFLVTSTDNTGATTTYTTNSNGLTSRIEDASGQALDFEYNANNDRRTSVSQAGVAHIDLTYNKGQLSQLDRFGLIPGNSTEQKQTYSFGYDAFGNQKTIKVGDYTLVTNEYEPYNGNLKKTTYGNGDTVEYEYDLFDRIVVEKYNGIVKYRYAYNNEGDLSSKIEVDSSGNTVNTVNYEYDSLDRLIRSWEERTENGEKSEVQRSQHIYDGENRIKSQSWRVGNEPTRTESYEYSSADGSMKKMTTATGEVIDFTYDHLKRMSKQTGTILTTQYTYRDLDSTYTTNQVSGMSYSGVTDALAYSYTYDVIGNITEVKQNNAVLAQYTYDAQSQLIEENLPQSNLRYEYTYDTYGNIRSVKKYENGSSTATKTTTYQYNDTNGWLDLMTEYDGHALTYDQSGNPTTWYSTGKQWQLGWTSGELTSATADDMTISYGYDMDGVRDEKTVNGIKHEYVTQGGNVVYETWGNNKLEFIYGSSGEPYSVIYNGTTYYYVTNLQGDVVRLVNSSGTTVASYTYNGWGEVLSVDSNSSDNIANINPIRYRGYYYDNETGWYYLQSRYYDPQVKRFVSADDATLPLDDEGDLKNKNLYRYCHNNPVNFADSEGNIAVWLVEETIGAVVSVAAEAITRFASGDQIVVKDLLICGATGFVGGVFSGPTGVEKAVRLAVGIGSQTPSIIEGVKDFKQGNGCQKLLETAGSIALEATAGKVSSKINKVFNPPAAKAIKKNTPFKKISFAFKHPKKAANTVKRNVGKLLKNLSKKIPRGSVLTNLRQRIAPAFSSTIFTIWHPLSRICYRRYKKNKQGGR